MASRVQQAGRSTIRLIKEQRANAHKELVEMLRKFWWQIADDVHGNVSSNRQAVEVLVDRAYDDMTDVQKAALRATSVAALARVIKIL